MQTAKTIDPPPRLSDLGLDLLKITPAQRTVTLVLPFLLAAGYFAAAICQHWFLAVAALVYLSFVTYGSTSHDLVHRNLGLENGVNDFFLVLVELLALRSGHAYRLAHLHHHARFPNDDDLEAAAAKKTILGALFEGVIYHWKLWIWALRRSSGTIFGLILAEGILAMALILCAILALKISYIPMAYVLLMITGAWITPLVTSYIPHDPSGANALEQTRLFRGRILSVLALEHLYHLEHHLYPAVPHQNWPILARRLDPYFEKQGIKPIKLWF